MRVLGRSGFGTRSLDYFGFSLGLLGLGDLGLPVLFTEASLL